MPSEYNGPPIKVNFSNGGVKIQGGANGIKVGGHAMALAAGNNTGCYNNLQCQEQFDERYSCVKPGGGQCYGGDSGCVCKCTDNSDPFWPCETPTPTPSPTPSPTPTSTPEPTPTADFGAWCVQIQSDCDGNFYRTGACSSGTWSDWKTANDSKAAGNLQWGSNCSDISCPAEATPTCTPTQTQTPTYSYLNMIDAF